jgi:hypothetical protein
MTIRTIVLSIAFLVPLAAYAQAPKRVEVINDPLVVEVTNLPAVQDVNVVAGATGGCEVKTIQLIGFTSTFSTGNLGGVLGSTLKCQQEFPLSRMCTFEEIQKSTNLPAVGQYPDFAWMEPISGSCSGDHIINGVERTIQWTCDDLEGAPCRFPGATGRAFESTGSLNNIEIPCSEQIPIACCALVP